MSVTGRRELQRDYPHVITHGGRRNLRRSIEFVDAASCLLGLHDPHVFIDHGLVDEEGDLTVAGRTSILERFAERTRHGTSGVCIAWSTDDCTWLDTGGRQTHGNRPPTGEIDQPHLMDTCDAMLEDVWTVKLPAGCTASHLCIRQIDASLVEITPGERVVLGSFHDLPKAGRHDPAASMMSRGTLKPPARFRGQPVTEVRDRFTIMGPVQPSDVGIILRNAWPADVRRACDVVAGRPLAAPLHQAVWRALNPPSPDMNHVGVLKAA